MTQPPHGSLRHTLRRYRVSLLIAVVGAVLSIAGFMLVLDDQAHERKNNFMFSAAQEVALFDGRFLLFEEKTRGVAALFDDASDRIDRSRMSRAVAPTLAQVPIEVIGWLPGSAYGGGTFSVAQPEAEFPADIEKIAEIPEIQEALRREQRRRDVTISMSFLFGASGKEERYLAFLAPLVREGAISGTVVALVNEKQLYNDALLLEPLRPHEATIYTFGADAGNRLAYVLGHPLQPPRYGSPDEWQNVTSHAAYFYSQPLRSTQGQRTVVFVPTPEYLRGAPDIWPWIVLLGGLAITWLVSLLLFQQARRQEIISGQVGEKTQRLREATRTLAEKENKLRAIVENTLDGLITINTRGIVESFNPACERIFGYRAAEVIGQNIKMLMPEPYHSAHDGYLSGYARTGEGKIIGTAGREVSAQRKDGSVFPMDLSISTFQLDDGQYFSGIIRDITDRKQAEEALRRSNEELEKFAYIASHDLKAPLRNIDSLARWVIEDTEGILPPDARQKLDLLCGRVAALETLLDDVLSYSRAGRIVDAPVRVDVGDMLARLVQIHVPESFRTRVAGKMPVIFSPQTPLEQVFGNLLSNAVKHHDRGGGLIEIEAHDAGNFFEFTVRDDGPGIPPEFHERAFQMFQTLQSRDAVPGSGLGMAIIKKLVEWQGGRVWIVSAAGQRGTAVHFLWPRGSKSDVD